MTQGTPSAGNTGKPGKPQAAASAEMRLAGRLQAGMLSFAALMLGLGNMAWAATTSAQFRVTATIVAYCENANVATIGPVIPASGVDAVNPKASSLAVTCNHGTPYQVALQDVDVAMPPKAAPLFDWSISKLTGSAGSEFETRVLTLSF